MTSKRQRARLARTDAVWRAKYAAAVTLGERAAVAFDEVRAVVADLPPAQRERALTQLVEQLQAFRRGVTQSHVHA